MWATVLNIPLCLTRKRANIASVECFVPNCGGNKKERNKKKSRAMLPFFRRGGMILLPLHALYDDGADIPSFDVFDLTPSSFEWGGGQPDLYGSGEDITPSTLAE